MATSSGSGLKEDSWETVINVKKKQIKPQLSESVGANKFAHLPRPLPIDKSTNQSLTDKQSIIRKKYLNEVFKDRAEASILRKEQTYAHLNQASNTSVAMTTAREMPTGSVKNTSHSISVTAKKSSSLVVKNPSLTESSRVWLPTAMYEAKSKKGVSGATATSVPPVTSASTPMVAAVSPAQIVTKGISFFDVMAFPKKLKEMNSQSTTISALDSLNSRIKNKTGIVFNDNNHIKNNLDENLQQHRFIPKKQKKKKLSVLKKKIFMVLLIYVCTNT
jgi:hypothetical protein